MTFSSSASEIIVPRQAPNTLRAGGHMTEGQPTSIGSREESLAKTFVQLADTLVDD
jgi:hypothetical protein